MRTTLGEHEIEFEEPVNEACVETEPSGPWRRLPEDFRSEALSQAMSHCLRGADPDLVIAVAAKFEAYLAQGAQPEPNP